MSEAIFSDVQICNLALDLLKEDRITSIETPITGIEILCARWYPTSRRAILRKHAWNFANKRAVLAASSITPLFGYSDAYPLPSDFLRLLGVGTYQDLKDYALEDDNILINNSATSLPIRYVADVTDVAKFDSLFIEMLAMEMAIKMAYAVQKSMTSVQDLREDYKELCRRAKAIDGQERPPKVINKSNYLDARYRYGAMKSPNKWNF